jgi:2-methylcitrate dehydratase PrpD
MTGGLDAAAAFAAARHDVLPAEVAEWFPLALLDTISVLAAGTTTRTFQAAAKTAARWPGAPAAAFANAIAANAFDYEDGHYLGGDVHPGSTVVPALLAAVDGATPLSQLLVPVVVGYEVAIRAGFALSPAVSGEPYRASGHAACLGAAAAIANALGLGLSQASAALRIADSDAPVSRMRSIAAKESIGWAAATAVMSAAQAQDGLEPTVGAHPPMRFETTFDLGSADFMRDWSVFHCTDVYTKLYASCRAGHSALDALVSLRVDPGSISEVRIGLPAGMETLDQRDPRSLEEAQFSIPIVVAALLEFGEVTASTLNDRTLDLLRASRYLDLVHLFHDPALDLLVADGYPASVTVVAGASTHETVFSCRGDELKPLSVAERLAKALACLELVMTAEAAQSLVNRVLDGSLTVEETTRLIAAVPAN